MHKCQKCQTEFGGKFCPECGSEWVGEKTCPVCGTTTHREARFCEECGYSYSDDSENTTEEKECVAQQPEQIRQVKSKPSVNKQNVSLTLIKYSNLGLLTLFSVLMFVFFSVNIATMSGMTVMGVPLPKIGYGSVFVGIFENLPEINGVIAALIVFTVVSLIYTIACYVTMIGHAQYRQVLLFGKYDIALHEVLTVFSPIIYLIFIILGGVLMSRLSSLDGGTGRVTIAAYPKLVLSFAIIFFVVSFIFSILRLKKNTIFLVRSTAKISISRQKELSEFYATHEAPIEDKSASVEQAVAYKYDKHRYDNGREGKTSPAVVWFDINKEALLWISIIVAIFVVLLATVIPYFTNKFRAGAVEKIYLGYTGQQVEEELGKPYDEINLNNTGGSSNTGSGLIDTAMGSVGAIGGTTGNSYPLKWRYFDKAYAKARKEAEAQAGSNGLTGVPTALASLYGRIYDYIEVDFDIIDDEYRVVRVVFEKSRCDAYANVKRKVKVLTSTAVNINYIKDETLEKNNITFLDCSFDHSSLNNDLNKYIGEYGVYTAYFKGGSYIRNRIGEVKPNGSIENDDLGIAWKDEYAEYTAVAKNTECLGYVTKSGEWMNNGILSSGTVDYLPNSVKSIGDKSFSNCIRLTSIEIPDSVTSIGASAFRDCSSLTSIEISKGVTNIGDGAFDGCTKLTSITIPNSVKSIGDKSFSNCIRLTSIEIPNSVTRIGNRAFYNCSSLTSIKFNGTKAQWKTILKGRDWNLYAGFYTVICTDGELTYSQS